MSFNIIKMNRGDSHDFVLTIMANEECIKDDVYKLIENDKVYFGLMEPNMPFECSILKKVWTAEDQDELGNIVIKLEPKETEFLVPGLYYYAVKLEMNHSDPDDNTKNVYKVVTIINKTKFIIFE